MDSKEAARYKKWDLFPPLSILRYIFLDGEILKEAYEKIEWSNSNTLTEMKFYFRGILLSAYNLATFPYLFEGIEKLLS